MATPIHLRNHPFPVLLLLEWGLLAIALVGHLAPAHGHHGHGHGYSDQASWLGVASIIAIALMGIRLPSTPWAKVAYTALEFGLILVTPALSFRRMRLFPFLYLVVILRSCLMFQLRGRLIVSGLAYGLFAGLLQVRLSQVAVPLHGQERLRGALGSASLNVLVLFALVLVFVLLLIHTLLAERQSREALAIANQRLRDYALKVEELAITQERNRIAQDIHDSLGHLLTTLNVQLEGAIKLWAHDPQQAQQFLNAAKQLGSSSLREVRQSVAAIRQDPLEHLSLEEAIATLLEPAQSLFHIHPVATIHLNTALPQQVKLTLYRIVQEALTNIYTHAQATAIAIEVSSTPAGIRLSIWDNGQGFDPAQNQTGFGLQGMRERTLALGGTFHLVSAPQQGCQITIHVPLTLSNRGNAGA
jgi:signal transduction histidine kinase